MILKFQAQTGGVGRQAEHAEPHLLEYYFGTGYPKGYVVVFNNCSATSDVSLDRYVPLAHKPKYGWLRFHLKPLT